jgi:hypothetical protein
LAEQGYVLRDYPEIPFPGETSSTKLKGVAKYTKKQREILLDSLHHPTHPFRFEAVSAEDHVCKSLRLSPSLISSNAPIDLKKNSKPVIIGVRPSSESKNKRGRRQFANNVCDNMGLERASGPSAATVVKTARHVDPVLNDDSSDPQLLSSSPTPVRPAKNTYKKRPAKSSSRRKPKSKAFVETEDEDEEDEEVHSEYDAQSVPDSDIEEIVPVSKKRKSEDTLAGGVKKVLRSGGGGKNTDSERVDRKGKRKMDVTSERSPPLQKHSGNRKDETVAKGIV